MADLFAHQPAHLTAPIEHAAEITPADGADLTNFSRAIYVGVSGNIKVDLVGGETAVTFVGLAAGVFHPIRATRIYSTDTTATSIVAGW
jgi:hypothetical protein